MFVYARTRYKPANEAVKAAFFGLFVLSLIVVSVAMALASGPIVLGTEMNTNGLVEYLCLGKGCEDMHAMDW